MRLKNEDIARVKGLGFLRDKLTEDCFNGRVITVNGKITAEQLDAISTAAKLYGKGEVAFTTRGCVEIQSIPYENIEKISDYLLENGLEFGGTGPKVRPIVSCKGTTCSFGLIDTFKLAEEIHHLFYKGYRSVKLPHKFKIAVGGCPNNCVKPDINDIGIIGQNVMEIDETACRGCKVCSVEKGCPMNAVSVAFGKAVIDYSACINCGRCKKLCPFTAVKVKKAGYKMHIGGRWGKKVARGIELNKIFETKEEVLSAIEKTILFFKENGNPGERFSDTISRIGFEITEKEILADDILKRKEEILSK